MGSSFYVSQYPNRRFKKMSLKVILGLVAFVALISDGSCDCSNQNNEKLTITISFESEIICTNHFFGSQLTKEILQEFEKCNNIKWVFEPCENSHICPETNKLSCYGGEEQCTLDRIQACAGALNKDNQFHYGLFVACMLNTRDPLTSGPTCAGIANLCWNQIDQCIKCGDGDKHCDQYYQTITKRKPKWIPSIMFDGKYVEKEDTQAKEDFTKTVCHKLKGKGLSCDAVCKNVN